MNKLADRVAVITGSSSGIGRAITLALASEGVSVVCSDLNKSAARKRFKTPMNSHEFFKGANFHVARFASDHCEYAANLVCFLKN